MHVFRSRLRPNDIVRTWGLVVLAWGFSALGTAAAAPVNYDGGAGVAFDSFGLATSLFVPNNDNRILIVGFASTSENFVDIVPTSLTFAGQELTYLGGIVQNVFTDWYARSDIYYLINPPAGTGALNGSVNAAGPSGFRQGSDWGMFALALSNAAQEAPRLAFTKLQNPSAPSSTIGGDVTTTGTNSMLVGVAAINAGINNVFSTSGVVEDFDTATGDLNFAVGHKLVSDNPETFTWITNGFASGIGAVAIAEVAAVSTVPVPASLPLLLGALAFIGARRIAR